MELENKNMISPSEDAVHEVEAITNKKEFKGKIYYKVKWVGYDESTWELAENCTCKFLINQFENQLENVAPENIEPDEWEVEDILDKRIRKNKIEYLVKWRGWPGGPTWERADNCDCYNLIARFENPKLKKLWDFRGSNVKLWLNRDEMLEYMQKYIEGLKTPINLLTFEPDFPAEERRHDLEEGLNIGPLCYENHWYLVVIIINHICVTRRILVGDPLNTLIGVVSREHPVVKRLSRSYPQRAGFRIKPITMTQMERSDVCAYYVLAGFARAIFLLDRRAHVVSENLFFESSKAELIRSYIRPDTNGEISVSLPVPEALDHGPCCELCLRLYDTQKQVDEHIVTTHMSKRKSSSVSSN